jgi:hypothetical protein
MNTTQIIRLATSALTCATGFTALGASLGGTLGVLVIGAGNLVAGLVLVGAGLHLRRAR